MPLPARRVAHPSQPKRAATIVPYIVERERRSMVAAAAAEEASTSATSGVVAASAAEDAAPPFDLEAPRFDQSTYWGRLSHFLQMTDMRLILTTDEQLADARAEALELVAAQSRHVQE